MTTETKPNITFGGTIPKIYDEVLGPVYFEPYAIDIADRVAALKPATILETACGTGRVTMHLNSAIPNAQITATDINPDMFAIAQQKLKGSSVEFKQADATALPFPDNSFDCVVAQFGIMFYPDKVKGIAEALRVLKPGGTYIFNVWGKIEDNGMSQTGRQIVSEFFENDPPAFYNIPYSMHNVEDVLDIIKKGGFTDVQHEVLTKESIADSAEFMSAGLVEGNPIANAVRERDPAAVEILKAKVFETLVKRFGDHPCKTSMRAIVFTAKK
ncbi:MAG: methyltransferase domain-containing protein, partial [Bacteroidota bacterium]